MLGAGGHAKSVIASIESIGEYNIVGFIDSLDKKEYRYKNYRVLGQDKDLNKIYKSGIQYAFITIGYMGKDGTRVNLYKKLKQIGYNLPVIVDKSAIIENNAYIEEGSYIGKRAIVNSDAVINRMCIINTNAVVEHECNIGAFSHISVGAVICGNSKIGEECFIGANSTVIQNIFIGNQVIVGAGAVVTSNLIEKCVAVGVPAKMKKGAFK